MANYRQLIREALALDISDLSFLYRPQNIDITLLSQIGQPKPGLLVRFGSFLWQLLRLLRQWPTSWQMPHGRAHTPLFFVTTNNQTVALQPLVDQLPESTIVGLYGFGQQSFPLLRAYLWAIPFFPLLLLKFFQAKGAARRSFTYVLDAYWLSYGYYIVLRKLLQQLHPSVLIMANDHIIWTRTLLLAAKKEGIPTIYLQHASVTERFPPLTFDFALLEGVDAAEKYAACGPSSTKIFLVGLPRFDAYHQHINQNSQVQSIGICTNPQNSLEEVAALASALQQHAPQVKVIFRPHPGDTRQLLWQDLAQQASWLFSNGRDESAFHFLTRVDTVLAGDSNILLEAALMNVYPIYYDFLGQKLDWYGFYKNGLTPYFADPADVAQAIHQLSQHKPDVRSRTKRYCASVDTAYDGRSAHLCANLVQKIITHAPNLTDEWQRIPHLTDCEVYEVRSTHAT